MASEDDAWAQTLITVTPEEDATIREISNTTTLSSTSDTSLALDADKIVYRRSFTHRQFIDSKEPEQGDVEVELVAEVEVELVAEVELTPEERSKQDAQNQTYLQGMPVVQISIENRDEASQTMYMSSPCPPLKYFKDILTSMNESLMPMLKETNATATFISFPSEAPQDAVIDRLLKDVEEEELEKFEFTLSSEEEAQMEIDDILRFLTARSLWIVDPGSQGEAEATDKETQTRLRFNYHTNTLICDRETQTELTCEPKKSNTTLLSGYMETRNMISDLLEECISRGVEAGTVIEDIMDEIIDKSADRIRLPKREQITQTIAAKLHEEKEADVLRRLRVTMIVDPLEASIVVVPLMHDILQIVCDNVSRNASKAVKNVIAAVLRRTMIIVSRLVELQKESKPKPIDKKLEQRRKKILESMTKKETETVCTQTSLAGIYEVKRRKESRDLICSVCRRPSMCQACLMDQDDVGAPWQDTKVLRTQDILLAYKPCYIVTKASEKDKKGLLPSCPPVAKVQPPPPLPLICTSKYSAGESSETINVFLQPEQIIKPQASINEWSHIIDATFMKPCSMKESISTSRTTISSNQDSLCLRSTLAADAANALQILKNTFCTQETCIATSLHSLKESCTLKERTCNCVPLNSDAGSSGVSIADKAFGQHTLFCMQQTCKPYSKLHLPKTSSHNKCNSPQTQTKSRGDGFKIIPIRISPSSDA